VNLSQGACFAPNAFDDGCWSRSPDFCRRSRRCDEHEYPRWSWPHHGRKRLWPSDASCRQPGAAWHSNRCSPLFGQNTRCSAPNEEPMLPSEIRPAAHTRPRYRSRIGRGAPYLRIIPVAPGDTTLQDLAISFGRRTSRRNESRRRHSRGSGLPLLKCASTSIHLASTPHARDGAEFATLRRTPLVNNRKKNERGRRLFLS
jgi:hypothetical protein